MTKKRTPIALALLLSSFPAPPAFAQDEAAAEALFRSAREASQQGDWITACDRFEESNRLDPAPGTVLNIGRCREKLGQLASAWKSYEEAAQRLPSGDRRAKFARKRADALQGRVPHLTLLAPEEDGEYSIEVNGVKFEAASLGVPLPFDPGQVTVVVRAKGRAEWTVELGLAEADRTEQRLELGPIGETEAPEAATSEDPGSENGGDQSNMLAYSLLGVGGAGLAAAVFGGVWIGVEIPKVSDECPDGVCLSPEGDDARARGRAATTIAAVGSGVALLGLGLGTYLLLGDDDESVSLIPQTDGVLFNYSGSF